MAKMFPIPNVDIPILLWLQKEKPRKWCIILLIRWAGGRIKLNSLDQSNENAFTQSVSEHKYLELNVYDLQFLFEANLSTVILPYLLSIVSIKLEKVNQSSLSMFLLSASACVFCFRGIQKTEILVLKTDVNSKILTANPCNFPLLLPFLTIKLLAKLSVYQ